MPTPQEPEAEFSEVRRGQNRNFSMTWDIEEGLRRAAIKSAGEQGEKPNVSLMFRMIADGRLDNLVELQLLCPLCREIDCDKHTPRERQQWFRERDLRRLEALTKRFQKSRAKS